MIFAVSMCFGYITILLVQLLIVLLYTRNPENKSVLKAIFFESLEYNVLYSELFRDYFPSGASLHPLSKLYDVLVGFVASPSFEDMYCFICGRQTVAVPRYWMICLVLILKTSANRC